MRQKNKCHESSVLISFFFILIRYTKFFEQKMQYLVLPHWGQSLTIFIKLLTAPHWATHQQKTFKQTKQQASLLEWKKALRGDANTPLAVVGGAKKFRPAADPCPGAQDGQNLISWRWSLPLPTNPVWWGSMHTISSYRGNKPTHKHTNPQTHRQNQLQYTVP